MRTVFPTNALENVSPRRDHRKTRCRETVFERHKIDEKRFGMLMSHRKDDKTRRAFFQYVLHTAAIVSHEKTRQGRQLVARLLQVTPSIDQAQLPYSAHRLEDYGWRTCALPPQFDCRNAHMTF
ncbi:MAG TPA: hypothetical protein PL064_10285 [Thermogutta sp.]|nr:hypothetical protein [Thermogutta sp.]HPZ83815.1 hypothetical protein [Thermogutta sp.]